MTGLEPFIPLLGGIMLDVLKDSGKKEGEGLIARWMNRDVGKDVQDVVFKAAGKYIENYTERHGVLKVLGMREPVKLDEVFTTVQLLGEDEVQQFATIDDLEKLYREAGQRLLRYRSKERQDGIAFASQKQFLMVLGAPGAGKSTFLRKIGLESFKGKKGNFKHQAIPVLLELKKFTESKIDLKALIEAEFTTCGFPKPKQFTESALDQGKLLILLDGLDEVPSANVNSVIDAIQDFVDRYDKNRYIASCRTAAYRYNFKRFSDVILSEFDDEQIQQFINNWFRSEEDKQAGTAALCWELLKRAENKPAKELAHSPILLTFLCLTYDKSQTFANNRSGLYKKALRILLEEWAAEKRIMRQAIYEGLSVELEEVLLSKIACEGFEADRLFIPQTQLVERIKEFLSSNLNAPKQLSGEQVLEAIAIQQGILVERVEDVYSFSHLTLQEYLTARYIYAHGQISQMVEKYLIDDRWREVFLLTSGLMVERGSDELLLEMHKVAKHYARHPKVKALLQWADQVTAGSSGNFKPAAKRAVAIGISRAKVYFVTDNFRTSISSSVGHAIASFINIDFTRASLLNFDVNLISRDSVTNIENDRDSYIKISIINFININPINDIINNIDINIVSNINLTSIIDLRLEKSGIFTDLKLSKLTNQLQDLQSAVLYRSDITRIKKVSELFICAYMEVFHLTEELIDYSSEESKALNNYLRSIDLLLKCKQEAARLSPATWDAIEADLLLPPDD
ncbi:NACHT domain-containing protein [Pseudanabaena sp. FACHB-1998]|uniref:NACHT domain-containing protein n=1 Tax=Pseudanabaena sp. FACHB-1998 TaxID=2692858 RepID=UPI001680B268|nr:NACHT domain-containing protein [Pseudanabaena sp. FACHB-1998]MBD2176028.1 NACHT domain-containing protein [Pseudanabaena sp. FACHB-1998]